MQSCFYILLSTYQGLVLRLTRGIPATLQLCPPQSQHACPAPNPGRHGRNRPIQGPGCYYAGCTVEHSVYESWQGEDISGSPQLLDGLWGPFILLSNGYRGVGLFSWDSGMKLTIQLHLLPRLGNRRVCTSTHRFFFISR